MASSFIASMLRVWAIAHNTIREAVRNRVLGVLVMFSIGLMAFSLALGELSLNEEERIIKDLGLAGIDIFGLIISLFLGVNLLSKELDRKTVYGIIPKPLNRWEFFLGKYIGLLSTMWGLVALMSAVLATFLWFQDGQHDVMMVRAEVLIALELSLVVAVAMLFSSFSSPYLSAMFTGAMWVIGRNTAELEMFAGAKLSDSIGGDVMNIVLKVVPDFRMFYISGANLGGHGIVSVHGSFVTWAYVGSATFYFVTYAAVCMIVGAVLFRKRDLT